MRDSPDRRARKSPVSAENRTRFPSLRHWEAGWESAPGLKQLRANRPVIEAIATLTKQKGVGEGRAVEPESIAALVGELGLGARRSAQLLEDSLLISAWYRLPAQQERLGLGHRHHLKMLTAAAKSAGQLYDELAPDAAQVEELIRSLPAAAGEIADHLDLVRLTTKLASFISATEIAISWLGTGAGRKPDRRRNQAMALITAAVEEATDIKVGVSRGNRNNDDRHFTNAPGRFLLGMLRLLGHRNERALVSVFEELRRPLAARKSR